MLRHLRLVIVASLCLAVASSAFAACLPGEVPASAEMACCKSGHHECGQTMQAADCCKSTTVSADKFIAARPTTATRPALVFANFSGIAAIVQVAQPVTSDRSEPVPSASPPVYLRISSLRI